MFSYSLRDAAKPTPLIKKLVCCAFLRVLMFSGMMLTTMHVQAQVTTADITGTIVDSSDAAIPNAKVTVKNVDTGIERSTASDTSGNYLVSSLPVGHYSVRVETSGFKTWNLTDAQLAVGDRLRIDVQMQVGRIEQQVEVTAEVTGVQTDSSTLGTYIDTRAVQDLPTNGRNFITLVQLAAGANDSTVGFGGGTGPDDRRQTSQVTVNGQYAWANNFLIDGMDNNERFIGTTTVKPSVEAIQEMKVQTNLYSAELGRTASGVINLITKSGTNQFRGSLYEFFRNEKLDAKNFFAGRGRTPPYKQNQFGGSLGGPIRKDRTFFFGDYEALFVRQGLTSVATVPTVPMRNGDFSQVGPIYDPLSPTRVRFANDFIPVSRRDLIGNNIIQLYPGPTNNGISNNFVSSPAQKQDQKTYDARIDHKFSDNDQLFGRYTLADVNSFLPGAIPIGDGGFGGSAAQRTQGVGLGYVHTFGPRWVMELRAGYSRYSIASLSFNPGKNLSQQVGLVNSNVDFDTSGLVRMTPSGYTSIGDGQYVPEYNTNNVYQYGVAFTHQAGSHGLKFGADLRKRQVTQYQSPQPRGTFSFQPSTTSNLGPGGNSIASMMLGFPFNGQRQKQLIHPGYRFSESDLYIQDDWRVRPWLTLNLGLRYDYYSPLAEYRNQISNLNLQTAKIVIAGQNGTSKYAGPSPDWINISPRFGFAATVTKKTVIRGGYGISFVPPFMGSPYAMRNPPFVNSWSIPTATYTPVYKLTDGLPPVVPSDPAHPAGTINAVSFNFQVPYIHQFNLTVQRELPLRLVSTVSYVGQLGRKQFFPNASVDYDLPGPGNVTTIDARRPYASLLPNVTSIPVYGNYSNTSYNALQATLERRFASGFGTVATYTYAHTLDNYLYRPGATQAFVKGNSNLDVRHRFTATANYQLPFARGAKGFIGAVVKDWQVNGIAVLQTSLPFNVTNGTGVDGTGDTGNDFPNLVADPYRAGPVLGNSDGRCQATISQGGRAPDKIGTLTYFFNPCAFQRQSSGTYGNLGRNIMRGPNWVTFNFSAFKDFAITERLRFQVRGEFFNIFNHPNFLIPNGTISSAGVGSISSAQPPRNVQLAMKLVF